MKYRMLLGAAAITVAAHAGATPAMSVLTVNTSDPMGYMQWAQGSGEAIAKSIDASLGGICVGTAGYWAPGELYYWHVFDDHATAMSASIYGKEVQAEVAKLKVDRVVSRADAFSAVYGDGADLSAGDSYAVWNLVVSTDDPGLYVQQIARINAAADNNGFKDASVDAYRYLTNEQAGDMLIVVRAPDTKRLGAFLDQLNSDWMAPIMADLASIRAYERGFMASCTVLYAK